MATALARKFDPVIIEPEPTTVEGTIKAVIVGATAIALFEQHGKTWTGTAWARSYRLDVESFQSGKTEGGAAEFDARVADEVQHQSQKLALGRYPVEYRDETPWGTVQGAEDYGRGIISVSTAGHGGFVLGAAALAEMHPALRQSSRYFEEDSEWAKVAMAFPDRFTDRERRHARDTLLNWYPDAFETVTGEKATPDNSFRRAEQAFRATNDGRYVVRSASRDPANREYILGTAHKLGDDRRPWTTFRIAAVRYEARESFGMSSTRASTSALSDRLTHTGD